MLYYSKLKIKGPASSAGYDSNLDGDTKETSYSNYDTSGIRSNALDNSVASSSGGHMDSLNSSYSRNDNSGDASCVDLDSFNLSSRSFVSMIVLHKATVLITIILVIYLQGGAMRRCRALYDCNADNDDELEFKEGEILIVLNERTDDENWMEGQIEGDSMRRGMFPVSFVQMMDD